MRFIELNKGIDIISSSIQEDEYPIYEEDTTYNEAQRVIFDHLIWESRINENDTSPAIGVNWKKIQSTNKYSLIDFYMNTQSQAPDSIIYEFELDNFDAIGLMNIEASEVYIKVEDLNANTIVKELSTTTIKDYSSNWYEYFYNESEFQENFIIRFAYIVKGKVTIEIKSPDSISKIGYFGAGKYRDMGITLDDVTVELIDYSEIIVSDEGFTTFKEGPSAKLLSLDLVIPTKVVDKTIKYLEKIKAKPSIFLGDDKDNNNIESLCLYGYSQNITMIVKGDEYSNYSMEVLSLT